MNDKHNPNSATGPGHCTCGDCQGLRQRLHRLEMLARGVDVWAGERQVILDTSQPDGTFNQREALRKAHAAPSQLPQHVQEERAHRRKKGRWNWALRLANQLFFYRHDHETTVWRCYEFGDVRRAGLAQQALLQHARKIDSQALHGWKFETHVDRYGDLYVRKVRAHMSIDGDKCTSYIVVGTVDVDATQLGEVRAADR